MEALQFEDALYPTWGHPASSKSVPVKAPPAAIPHVPPPGVTVKAPPKSLTVKAPTPEGSWVTVRDFPYRIMVKSPPPLLCGDGVPIEKARPLVVEHPPPFKAFPGHPPDLE